MDVYSLAGIIVSGFLFLPGSRCFHDGAPLYACEFMEPGVKQGGVTGDEGHTAPSQDILPTYGNSRTPPYHIMVQNEALTYTPGQSLQLSIVANQSRGSNMFKGILLMARQVTCYRNSTDTIEVINHAVGSFSIPSTSVLKTLDCFEISASAVTHSSPQYKTNETITWRPPATSAGNIVFKATIVGERTTYWMNLYSPVLRDATVNPPEPTLQCSAATYRAEALLLLAVALSAAIFVSKPY